MIFLGDGWRGCGEEARIRGELGEHGVEDGFGSEKEKGEGFF